MIKSSWSGKSSRKSIEDHGFVSLPTMILTQRGWLHHNELVTGDQTIGFDIEAGKSTWTRVTAINHHEAAEVWQVGHKYWHAHVTQGTKWWSETARKVTTGTASCPECGWKPRGAKFPKRGVQVHRAKIHGAPRSDSHTVIRGEYVRTDEFGWGNRLRLAAPAITDGLPGLTVTDARVLAWLQGDGHMAPVKTKPTVCPECGWLPGSTRRPHRGPVRQLATSVAVHRAKAHDVGRHDTIGAHSGSYDGAIYQSKPLLVAKISRLLADIPHGLSMRERGGNTLPAYTFRLRRSYVTALVERSGIETVGPEKLVISMSSGQRSAWLDSIIDAEGHYLKAEKDEWSDYVRIAQTNGPLQEAIKLAAYLEGYRPTYSSNSAERNGFKPAGTIGLAKPYVAPSTFQEPMPLGVQPVWAPETELGTWTAGLDGQVFLVGSATRKPERESIT